MQTNLAEKHIFTENPPENMGKRNVFQKITDLSVSFVQRFLPDAFTFAMIITILTMTLSLIFTPTPLIKVITIWGEGIWGLLAFTMQASLIALLGYTMATVPLVKKLMERIARLAKTPGQAIMLTVFVSTLLSWINWGLGLACGAMFAMAVARTQKNVHYPLLVASAYIGFLSWHGGLSGAIPLIAASTTKEGNFLYDLVGGIIPLSTTLWSTYNIVISLALLIIMPFVVRLMMPSQDRVITVDPKSLEEEEHAVGEKFTGNTFAEKLDNTKFFGILFGLLGLFYLVYFFAIQKGQLNYSNVISIFLFLSLLGHKSLTRFLNQVYKGIRSVAPIAIQFPFYAGIMAVLEHTGLGTEISQAFIHFSTKDTFTFWVFLSSGITNFMVPSGGGHWAVQGPYIIPAAKALGVDLGRAAMAVSYGEAWMNMAQPFWALPILGIAKLGIRDIMGYCLLTLLVSGVIFVIGVCFLPV